MPTIDLTFSEQVDIIDSLNDRADRIRDDVMVMGNDATGLLDQAEELRRLADRINNA